MNILSVPKAVGWALLVLLTVALAAEPLQAQRRGGRRGGDQGGDRGGDQGGDRGGDQGGDRGGGRFGGGPPGMMPGGGPPGMMPGGGPGGMRGGWGGGGPGGGGPGGGGPGSFIARLDSNGNGMLDPDEMQGRTRMMIERIAGDAKLDLSRPVPLDAITRAFENMRNQQSRDMGGDPRSRGGGEDRGGDRGGPSTPEVQPLVPGFGEIDLFDPVPGFGDLGEKFAVKIADEDRQEATRTMSRNDANKDGVLDAEEIGRGRWGDDALQTDRNRDGKLTLTELALRYAIRRAERDGGATNSRTASRGGSSRGGSNSASSSSDGQNRIVEMMFSRYDRDRNGVVENDELQAIRGGVERYDLNKDKKITRDELAKAMGNQSGGRGGGGNDQSRFFSRRGGDGESRGGDSAPSSSGGSNDSGRKSYRMATGTERLANFEGLPEWFARSDADADGQVKMSEYASSWSDAVVADFAQFDLNGDGIVTPSECLQAVERGAVQGAAPALAATSSSRSSSPKPAYSSNRGAPTRDATTTSADAATTGTTAAPEAAATPAAAAGNVSAKYVTFAVKIIKRYDSNNDGVLTEDEWKKMPQDYSGADTDKDGRITPVELGQAYASQR